MNISFFEDKPLLSDIDFKLDLLNNLSKTSIDELLNLIFHGYTASGKTTKIYALLATIFDKRVYDLKNMIFEEDRKTINYKSSIYHIEIDPIQLGSNDRFFLQTFLKSYTETRNIGLNIPKIILIKNANMLSKQSQFILRKMIEKTSLTAKYIFELSNLSNFISPLLSRCLLIRVKLPSKEEIKLCIKSFSSKKGYILEDNIINDIIDNSNIIENNFNLKKIFGYLRYYLLTNKKFKLLYYDNFLEIFNYITNKKISFITLQKIRELVNEMYINLVSMNELLYYLFEKLYKLYSNNNKILFSLVEITIECNKNIIKGNKDCIHIELYIISVIDLLNNL